MLTDVAEMLVWRSEGWTDWGGDEAGGIISAKVHEIGVLWQISFLPERSWWPEMGLLMDSRGSLRLARPRWIGDGIWG